MIWAATLLPSSTTARTTWVLACLGFLVWSGCTDQTSFTSETPLPTSILVSPEDFRGAVPCALEDTPDAMQSYQVTLLDVTGEEPFALPSSSLVPCLQPVSFTFVVPGRRYIARVSAFERADLSSPAPGYPEAVDENGVAVQPRGATTCYGSRSALDAASGLGGAGGAGSPSDEALFGGAGGADGSQSIGVVAVRNSVLAVRGCAPLLDSAAAK